MLDNTATVLRPIPLPIFTIVRAKASASFLFCINAPEPNFTSSTMRSAPLASFLLIMLLAMSGMLSTVAVISRRAYIFLSASTRLAVCPATAIPISFTCAKKRSVGILVSKPGIASSLSMVPPVKPKPRPDNLATGTPAAAARGASTSVVLSPTPPVLCLSTTAP